MSLAFIWPHIARCLRQLGTAATAMLCLSEQPEASVSLRPGSHLKPHRVPQKYALGHHPGEPAPRGLSLSRLGPLRVHAECTDRLFIQVPLLGLELPDTRIQIFDFLRAGLGLRSEEPREHPMGAAAQRGGTTISRCQDRPSPSGAGAVAAQSHDDKAALA